MSMLNWKATNDEYEAMVLISRKASRCGFGDFGDILMDLNATHSNGNPLNLEGLLAASPVDFSHDVCGIRRHLNRDTGKLMNCFTPRYSLHQVSEPKL